MSSFGNEDIDRIARVSLEMLQRAIGDGEPWITNGLEELICLAIALLPVEQQKIFAAPFVKAEIWAKDANELRLEFKD